MVALSPPVRYNVCMASTAVTLNSTSFTQVSADSATSVNLFLPGGPQRAGTKDTIEIVVAASAPADSPWPNKNSIFLQNSDFQTGAYLNLPLDTDEEAYARWVGPTKALALICSWSASNVSRCQLR